MANDFTICVGTVGAGVWFSPDGGDHWRRSKMKLPFYAEPGEIQVRTLAVSPHNPHHLLAGSEAGLYRSEDNGATWDWIDSPMEGKQIWSATFHPADPDTMLAGTKEPGVYRTNDRGQSWHRLAVPMAERCLAGAPKVTNILIDPRDKRTIWVGVEIDGVYCSRDDGQTWKHSKIGDKELNRDVHGVALATGPRPSCWSRRRTESGAALTRASRGRCTDSPGSQNGTRSPIAAESHSSPEIPTRSSWATATSSQASAARSKGRGTAALAGKHASCRSSQIPRFTGSEQIKRTPTSSSPTVCTVTCT